MNKQLRSSKVDFHPGNTLLMLAQTYVSLSEAIIEAVQNSLDSEATNIGVVIDRKQRVISIFDNGDGVTRDKFEEALRSVSRSVKSADKLGQFGLGLISPLKKCGRFTFTSCAKRGTEGYLEWTFSTDHIARQSREVHIPCRPRSIEFRTGKKNQHVPPGTQLVNWRTRVRIHDFVTDREVSRIQSAEALKDSILEKFGVKMRRADAVISIQIINEDGSEDKASGKAKLFAGKKLPEVVVDDADAGRTIFRMHLAKKSTFGFKGKVLVGEVSNDYRFPFATFAKSVDGLLSDDLLELFRSGVFEGEILTTNSKLHENRKSFVRNDALTGFCTAIEQWFLDHGKKHLKEVKEERQGKRIQDLSLKNLQSLESLLLNPAFDALRQQTIGSFRNGTVGEGHFSPDDNSVLREQDGTSQSVTAAKQKSRNVNGSGGGHSNEEPDKERVEHHPFTAAGPQGQTRKVVRGNSRGLQFDHVALRVEGPLWVLEPKNGTLFFNVEHPDWVAASNSGDRELMQLQEAGAIMALVHHTLPDEYKKVAELAYSSLVAPLSFLFCNSASYNLRARIRASKS